jgi:hypothetical protein
VVALYSGKKMNCLLLNSRCGILGAGPGLGKWWSNQLYCILIYISAPLQKSKSLTRATMADMVKAGKGAAGRGPDDIRSDNRDSNVIDVDSPVGGGSVERKRKRARAAPQSLPSAEELAARNKAYFLEAVTIAFIWQAIDDYNKSEVKCSCFSCHANGFG